MLAKGERTASFEVQLPQPASWLRIRAEVSQPCCWNSEERAPGGIAKVNLISAIEHERRPGNGCPRPMGSVTVAGREGVLVAPDEADISGAVEQGLPRGHPPSISHSRAHRPVIGHGRDPIRTGELAVCPRKPDPVTSVGRATSRQGLVSLTAGPLIGGPQRMSELRCNILASDSDDDMKARWRGCLRAPIRSDSLHRFRHAMP
jgi:hypothetical protein